MKLAQWVLCGLLVLACQTSVKADNELALAYLFGYGGFGGARMQSFAATPPYFALHPPVYYGERYTRPYGASPFAAWPQLQANPAYAPQRHVDRAHVIANPHYSYPASTPAHPGVVRVAPAAPVVIDNPYYPSASVYTSVVE
jgi:hypothetical protein